MKIRKKTLTMDCTGCDLYEEMKCKFGHNKREKHLVPPLGKPKKCKLKKD